MAFNASKFSLIITLLCFVAVIIIGCTIFVIRFSHPDDETGFIPKIIAIICFSASFLIAMAVPVSSANNPKLCTEEACKINEKTYFYVMGGLTLFFLLFLIPFSLSFFRSVFVGSGMEFIKNRVLHSLSVVLVVLIVFLVISLPLYFYKNEADLNFITYMISTITFISFFVFSVTLGIGIITLPASLFFYWLNRPTPMQREKFEEYRAIVGQKARKLREDGENLKKQVNSMKFLERRKVQNKFVRSVKAIKDSYYHLQVAFQFKGGNPIWPWFLLFLSILCGLISILFLVQLIMSNLVPPEDSTDIIGGALIYMTFDSFYVFSFTFFMFFVIYLLSACFFGLIQISNSIPFLILGYTMEPQNTFNDAFLVNAALIIIVSFPLLFLCYSILSKYVEGSIIASVVNKSQLLSFGKYFYENNVFIWLIICFSIISLLLCYLFPPKKKKVPTATLR